MNPRIVGTRISVNAYKYNKTNTVDIMNATGANDAATTSDGGRNATSNDVFSNPKLNAQTQLDVIYDVMAPENVAFEYCVAGPFSRAFAYALDLVAMFVYWLTSTLTFVYSINKLFGYNGVFGYWSDLLNVLEEVFLFTNTMFVVWFWNALFEAFWQGRTIGKAIVGLRAISCSGRPLRLSQAFVRNVLRFADYMLGPFVIPIMGLNDRMARLGDVAADTVVVVSRRKTKKFKRDKNGERSATEHEPFDENLLTNVSSKIPEDFVITDSLRKALFLYVSRRVDFAPQRRHELAKTLSDVLQDRMRVSPRLNPDVFLYALYKISLGTNRQTY